MPESEKGRSGPFYHHSCRRVIGCDFCLSTVQRRPERGASALVHDCGVSVWRNDCHKFLQRSALHIKAFDLTADLCEPCHELLALFGTSIRVFRRDMRELAEERVHARGCVSQ
jgi:hypothetical protein